MGCLWPAEDNAGLRLHQLQVGSQLQGLADIPDVAGEQHHICLFCHELVQNSVSRLIDGELTDAYPDTVDFTAGSCKVGEGQGSVDIFGVEGGKKNFHGGIVADGHWNGQ